MSRWTQEQSSNRRARGRSVGIDDAEVAALVRRLQELPGLINSDIQKLLKYAAEPMLEKARELAPDTREETTVAWEGGRASEGGGLRRIPAGDLKKSMAFLKFPRMRRNVIIGARLRSRAKTGMVGTYIGKVEYGTARMPARPFIRPAFDATKPLVVARLRDAIAGRIKPWAAKNERRRNS